MFADAVEKHGVSGHVIRLHYQKVTLHYISEGSNIVLLTRDILLKFKTPNKSAARVHNIRTTSTAAAESSAVAVADDKSIGELFVFFDYARASGED